MSKVIACVNEKGGVAKTTTVKNLAIGLAGKGKKVLVIDLDPSKNLTTSLGLFYRITNQQSWTFCEQKKIVKTFQKTMQSCIRKKELM